MTGADVGVVVVGETPYAEGYGDVGGPECGFCSPEQLEEKSLSLLPADKAVIDDVCDAIETCVVIVVSGRPQVLTDQLDKMDALVASWLPGSEGAGVADVLFGKSAVHRHVADDVATHRGAGPDQRRRRGLRPAVRVRVGLAY